ncbi:MAG TPA: 2-oxo-4-hydroxy-4-carboxy-5-ureidoimidazoline decarboxylase [Acidobacteriaceae bacterium]|jgi:OHCU decarboxylase|nr:2-oxo-4-hydroxy-4-carboxy-5-ureidoimidazoline decarboxylase [Acidobacteriaceae bacterium]
MRSHPAEYEIVSPGTLPGVLRLLDEQPGQWLPVAGATEVMVMFSAGKLGARRLVNLSNLPELQSIRDNAKTLTLGGGCTFSQIRNCSAVHKHFPLLAQAASWTGSIANQNRATLAGNLANASPAADSPPALLAYDAELELVSARETRRMPYREFHLGYKKTALRPGELILSVTLKKHYDGYFLYGRKTGARNAQAISKVCVAGIGRLHDGRAMNVRIGIGAVASAPLRLFGVEQAVEGKRIDDQVIAAARRALDAEIAPIDDIRSIAEYRRWVAGNLVVEFLRTLAASGDTFNPVLARWNALPPTEAAEEILPCCGSTRWARELAALQPLSTPEEVLQAADRVWSDIGPEDWDEAFRSHPRIGDRRPAAHATAQSATWSQQEQSAAATQDAHTLAELAAANAEYEHRFGRIFLVCATGKTAAKMLEILRTRLSNDEATELRETAEQERQITQLRLRKWLGL